MGELSRSVIDAAGAAGVQVSVCDYEVNNDARQQDYSAGMIQNEIRYSVNVCAVNADQTSALFETLPGDGFRNRYNIGYWAWEVEDFPAQYHRALDHYDEIWTISSFCQDAISRKAPIPVIRMPLVVNPAETAGCGREYFALRPDEFLFLSIFDLRSVFRRKNPLGVIQAFRLALSRLPDARLLLKVNNARQFPEQMQQIRTACAGLPVTVMDNVMSRAELNDLVACCDCVVSLHRSEGFGLVLAEAMYLAKPVMATAYSGNLDFTHPDTAFLVGGEMTEVGPDAGPYPAMSRWIEPDVSAAAEMLAVVRNDACLRERIARRGQDYIRRNFSAAAVGTLIRDRLALIRPCIEKRVSDRPDR
jgi:glycosyltransferase involved in cell wall biosynthesis